MDRIVGHPRGVKVAVQIDGLVVWAYGLMGVWGSMLLCV